MRYILLLLILCSTCSAQKLFEYNSYSIRFDSRDAWESIQSKGQIIISNDSVCIFDRDLVVMSRMPLQRYHGTRFDGVQMQLMDQYSNLYNAFLSPENIFFFFIETKQYKFTLIHTQK